MSQVQQQPQVVVVETQKSPMLAAVLGFFFGPLGHLRVRFAPAIAALLAASPLSA